MPERTALTAARAFGVPAGPVRPVRGGPSPVFDMTLTDGRRIALRLHDPATDPQTVRDGLRLAEALADAGLATPWPQRTSDGALTAAMAGTLASALHWVPATPLAACPADPARLHAVGVLLADLHQTADALAPRDLRLPDRRPTVPATRDPALAPAVDAARAALAVLGDAPGGVVLDDPGAVLSGADGLWLIGLDRAGTGWVAQDIAAALWPHADAPDLAARRAALVAGYRAGGGDAADAAPAAGPDRITLCLLLRALRAATAAPGDATARARAMAFADRLTG